MERLLTVILMGWFAAVLVLLILSIPVTIISGIVSLFGVGDATAVSIGVGVVMVAGGVYALVSARRSGPKKIFTGFIIWVVTCGLLFGYSVSMFETDRRHSVEHSFSDGRSVDYSDEQEYRGRP